MSKNWKLEKEIPVKGDKNIHGMLKATGMAAYIPQSVMNFFKYVLQGTCILAKRNMAAYLMI